jgi:hypothetical protein
MLNRRDLTDKRRRSDAIPRLPRAASPCRDLSPAPGKQREGAFALSALDTETFREQPAMQIF